MVEEALRAFLGYGSAASLWESELAVEPSTPSLADGLEPQPVAAPEPDTQVGPPPPRPVEPPPPLGPEEALALALAELHALRDDGAGGR